MIDQCYAFMNDDFNTARTLSVLFEIANKINAFKNNQLPLSALDQKTLDRLKFAFKGFIVDVLGLQAEKEGDDSKLDGLVQILISMRKKARDDKDWALSDQIRDQLATLGIILKDGKGETIYTLE